MEAITYAALKYGNVDFIIVEIDGTPDQMALSGGKFIDMFESKVFHKPVVIASKHFNRWMITADDRMSDIANTFDLEKVVWKNHNMDLDDNTTWDNIRESIYYVKFQAGVNEIVVVNIDASSVVWKGQAQPIIDHFVDVFHRPVVIASRVNDAYGKWALAGGDIPVMMLRGIDFDGVDWQLMEI